MERILNSAKYFLFIVSFFIFWNEYRTQEYLKKLDHSNINTFSLYLVSLLDSSCISKLKSNVNLNKNYYLLYLNTKTDITNSNPNFIGNTGSLFFKIKVKKTNKNTVEDFNDSINLALYYNFRDLLDGKSNMFYDSIGELRNMELENCHHLIYYNLHRSTCYSKVYNLSYLNHHYVLKVKIKKTRNNDREFFKDRNWLTMIFRSQLRIDYENVMIVTEEITQ